MSTNAAVTMVMAAILSSGATGAAATEEPVGEWRFLVFAGPWRFIVESYVAPSGFLLEMERMF